MYIGKYSKLLKNISIINFSYFVKKLQLHVLKIKKVSIHKIHLAIIQFLTQIILKARLKNIKSIEPNTNGCFKFYYHMYKIFNFFFYII
jgi:hypothetical protein